MLFIPFAILVFLCGDFVFGRGLPRSVLASWRPCVCSDAFARKGGREALTPPLPGAILDP
jgi:hypothetical protein